MKFNLVTIILGLIFSLAVFQEASTQEKSFILDIEYPLGSPHVKLLHDLDDAVFSDSLEMINALIELRDRYYKLGYLSAGIDSIAFTGDKYVAGFSVGLQYHWGSIEIPDNDSPNDLRIPKSLRIKAGKPVTIKDNEKMRNALADIYENNGYPFVSIKYDSLSFKDGVVRAKLKVEPGPLVIIDSIISRSEKIVSDKVLEQIIGIKPGQPYSEKKIIIASRQLQNSKIIQPVGPMEVGFNKDKAWVYVGAKRKMANSFDGIVGLVPGTANSSGIALTGSLDLNLNNLAKQAESFSIRWKAPGNQNQRLNAGLEIPYFLGWPVGLSSSMEIYKKDSSYLSTDWTVGVQAVMRTHNRLGFYFREKGSNVLLKSQTANYSNIRVKLYGLNWKLESLENPLNPVKGISVTMDIGIGDKNTSGQEIPEIRGIYWEGNGSADFYIPLTKLLVINLGGRGAYLKGGQVYDNEKFKIGGINSLRGFDEESLLADSYLIGTLEFRYLFGGNSNFHVFADGGKWWSEAEGNQTTGSPLGFGLGVSLETKAGIILLDYALGFSEEIPFSIRNGKIHLGIKSIF